MNDYKTLSKNNEPEIVKIDSNKTTVSETKKESDNPLELSGHLTELRSRIIRSLLFFSAALSISLYYSNDILSFFSSTITPALGGEKLVYISPAEAFFVSVQLSLYAALLLCIPYILYQIWNFIYIALEEKERKYFKSFLFFSTLFFYTGCAFAIFIAIPAGIKFLIFYSGPAFRPMISVGAYYDFLIYTSLTFAIVFELPMLMVFAAISGLAKPELFSNGRKYAVLIIFIIAGIFSPPDVVSQFLVAVPMLILYETGIIAIKLLNAAGPKK